MKRVACVSTGNTSASMAAYASAAGLQPAHLHPARQHLLRKAGAGAGIRRADLPGGRELRSDPGAGARARGAAGHLSAELDQSIPHRRPENHRDRDDGPARLESRRTGSFCRAATWEHLGLRKGASGIESPGLDSHKCPALRSMQAEGAAPFFDFVQAARAAPSGRSGTPKPWRRPSRSGIRFPGRKPCTRFELRTEWSKK